MRQPILPWQEAVGEQPFADPLFGGEAAIACSDEKLGRLYEPTRDSLRAAICASGTERRTETYSVHVLRGARLSEQNCALLTYAPWRIGFRLKVVLE